jgi:hypothetical protein
MEPFAQGAKDNLSRLENRYRRAFTWRVSRGGLRNQQALLGSVRLAASDYVDILEDYLYVSRKRQANKTALSKLQLQMLSDIVLQEQIIKNYKKTLEEGAPKDFVESQLSTHRMIANAIRQIGDGIAWRSFSYDRFTQRVLCSNAVNQIVLADGLVAEVQEWSAINDNDDRRAIFNAVTNCISIGDVTAIDANGNVELIEVKSGKSKDRRLIRQKNRLKNAAGILTSGFGIIEGKEVIAGSLALTPTNYLSELRIKLNEAGKLGWSAGLIAPHCYVDCFDIEKLGSFEGISDAVEEAHKRLDEQWSDELVTTWCSLDVIAFTPNVAPFSIFPFDDRTCVELMIGAKFFINSLNLSHVLRVFLNAGWSLEAALDEALEKTNGEAVVVMTKQGFLCHIPPADFAKLQYELLDPSTLLQECESLRSYGSGSAGAYSVWNYEGEAAQWI